MRYEIIGTGSRGNAVVIENYILIDCGVALTRLKKHLYEVKLVLLTHAHQDHFRRSTVAALSSARPTLRFAAGEWLAQNLVECGVSKSNIDVLQGGQLYNFGSAKVEPFALAHDVPNFGYKVYIGAKKLIYATDTGSLDGIEAKDFDIYMIEANHTESELTGRIAEKLKSGEYPYERNVRENHLSKEKADEFIYNNIGQNGVYIYLHTNKNEIF